ncbi:DUF2931 family protein [Tatumella saanichensis]|uniref:DUF2931 family protein n=1 Tax=Tatumella saanichensis TaxID=480813 RepID=UPI0004A2F1F9
MLKNPILLLLLITLSGCRAGEPQTPEQTGTMPYGEAGFAFFTPKGLPAIVTRALIIDSKKVVYTYRTLDSTQENPDSVGSWSDLASRHAQRNQLRHAPAQMLFCWDSIIDRKTYQTVIVFSPELQTQMSTPTGKDFRGKTAWYDTLLFGLAPEGTVRIWLQNTDARENLPVTPLSVTTTSGDKLSVCNKFPSRIKFNYSIPDGYDPFIKEFIKGKKYPYGNW